MSYELVVAGLHEAFLREDGLLAVSVGEPKAAPAWPFLYTDYDGFEREVMGTLIKVTYRLRHRLCVLWQDWQAAEADLGHLGDALCRQVEADPRLSGRLGSRGRAHVGSGEAGWAKVAGVECRVLDFSSQTYEYVRPGGA